MSYMPIPGKIPGTKVNLGGRDFIIAPLNLDGVQAVEANMEKVGKPGMPLHEALKNSMPVILEALKRNYPDITEAEVSALVDLGNFQNVLMAIVSVSGYDQAPPGEEPPASP